MVVPRASSQNVLMSTGTDRRTSVDAAISAVLAAEQEALAGIADCESRADRIRRDAQAAVRAQVRHAQDRITRLHADCKQRTDELVRALEREAGRDAAEAPAADFEQELLREAVRAVAAALTDPEASGGH